VVHKKNFISKILIFSFFLLKFFFSSCADISITSKDNNFILSYSTTIAQQNPLLLFPFNNPVVYTPTIIPSSFFIYPTTTTTTTTMNFIYPFHPSNELINQLNKNNKTLRCYPTNEALKPLVGIENWCLQLCAINCPPSLCICVKI
jgi:hypothetical protein